MTYEPWDEGVATAMLEPFTSDATLVLVALQALQARFGFVPEAAVPLVAHTCNVSRADVHGVLSFYHELRTQPPATREVRVCRAEACQAVGARDIERAFADAGHPVGSRTSALAVDAVYCLGNCALGPTVEIDGAVHGRCDTDIVREALR